jgi:hypothetical protein
MNLKGHKKLTQFIIDINSELLSDSRYTALGVLCSPCINNNILELVEISEGPGHTIQILQGKAFKFPNKVLLIHVQHERKKVFKTLRGKGD